MGSLQGLPIGRWLGIHVILHWTFPLYIAWYLFFGPPAPPAEKIMWLVVLFGTVVLHEFGHGLACRAMGGRADVMLLSPLGGMIFAQPPLKLSAWFITTVCGPLVNAVLWPLAWLAYNYGMPQLERLASPQMLLISGLNEILRDAIEINRALLFFNLIPAYPMDGGRLLQELLWFLFGYPLSLRYASMVGIVAGIGFIAIGMGLAGPVRIPLVDLYLGTSTLLAFIGLMCVMDSWATYQRANEIQSWRKR